jgi:HPr kinase/phosphorylase
MERVSVQQVRADLGEQLELEVLVALPDEPVTVHAADVHRPGMVVMGFAGNFLPQRLQVMGETEMDYVASLAPAQQRTALERILALEAPALFVARGLPVPEPVLEAARTRRFPILRSALPAVELINELHRYLTRAFAPRCEIHGTLVDVYGVGLLFTGRSGIGKSECALDLIERGHRLVADDVVQITRSGEEVLLGRFRDVLRHNIEIRGIGVIDVQAIFGIRAIRMQKRIEVEVHLQEWDDAVDYERIGMERRTTEILGVRIPRVIVPLFPGKNITVISEVIALDFMLNVFGYDAAQVLNQRILDSMQTSKELRRHLNQDRE